MSTSKRTVAAASVVKTGTTAAKTAGTSATGKVSIPTGPRLPLRPPLEAALDDFTRELRAALDRAGAESQALRAEVAALRAELSQLKQRYDGHQHTLQLSSPGGGGHQWIELRFLQNYIDGEQAGFEKYGLWAHGKSTADAPAEHQTGGPSS